MKEWYQSKTIWFNLLGILTAIALQLGWADGLGKLSPEFVCLLISVINIVLRSISYDPVRLPGEKFEQHVEFDFDPDVVSDDDQE